MFPTLFNLSIIVHNHASPKLQPTLRSFSRSIAWKDVCSSLSDNKWLTFFQCSPQHLLPVWTAEICLAPLLLSQRQLEGLISPKALEGFNIHPICLIPQQRSIELDFFPLSPIFVSRSIKYSKVPTFLAQMLRYPGSFGSLSPEWSLF